MTFNGSSPSTEDEDKDQASFYIHFHLSRYLIVYLFASCTRSNSPGACLVVVPTLYPDLPVAHSTWIFDKGHHYPIYIRTINVAYYST